jgi:hypothetical protein
MALAKEGKAGGFDTYIRRLIASQDGEAIISTFKEILLMTVGERSDDNKRFIKSDEITRNFVQSDAYSVLLMELLTDADKMSEFINGVVPSDMRGQIDVPNATQSGNVQGPQARVEEKRVSDVPPPKDERPAWLKEGRIPTAEELKGATPEQIQEAFKLRAQGAGPVTQETIPPQ